MTPPQGIDPGYSNMGKVEVYELQYKWKLKLHFEWTPIIHNTDGSILQ
jgi:hypothetical protein